MIFKCFYKNSLNSYQAYHKFFLIFLLYKMIKNVIYVLMIIICCLYGQNIPCKFGKVVGGVCKCDSIYTGANCSLSIKNEYYNNI